MKSWKPKTHTPAWRLGGGRKGRPGWLRWNLCRFRAGSGFIFFSETEPTLSSLARLLVSCVNFAPEILRVFSPYQGGDFRARGCTLLAAISLTLCRRVLSRPAIFKPRSSPTIWKLQLSTSAAACVVFADFGRASSSMNLRQPGSIDVPGQTSQERQEYMAGGLFVL